MPKVTLDFEVNDKGLATVKQGVAQASEALTKLGSSAAAATQRMTPLATLQGEMGAQFAQMRERLAGVSQSYEALAATTGKSTVSLGGLRTAMLAIGSGVVVGAIRTWNQETERLAERFASIDLSIRRLDFRALQSGIQSVTVELATADRQMASWVGRFTLGVENIARTLTGLPTTIDESRMALERMREGMAQLLPLQMGQEAAASAGTMAGLRLQGRQQMFGGYLARGMAGPTSIGLNADALKQAVRDGVLAAETQIALQRQREFAEAGARGTLDIESPAIQARYAQRLAELHARRDLQIGGIDEQARQQLEGVRGITEQRRSAAAGQGIAAQEARIAALQVERGSALDTQSKNFAWMKQKGFAPWLMTADDPLGKQLIAEQTRLKLMQIDEVYQKELAAIENLKLADDERITARGQAETTMLQQRETAIRNSYAEEQRLTEGIDTQLRSALAQAGEAIQSNLTDKFKEATSAAVDLAGEVASVQSRAYESSGAAQKGISWQEYRAAWRVSPGPGGTGGLDWSPPKIPPAGWEEPAAVEYAGEFQSGGVVPGPIGAPRLATVHGGETILPAGGGISLNFTVNGAREDPDILARRIGRAVDREIARLASRGQSRMGRA